MICWFWYIGDEDELLVDLDLSRKTLKRLSVCRARLTGAMLDNKLDVDRFAFYDSNTDFHYHLMVKLNSKMQERERLLWESRLCDDMFRNNMNQARLINTGKSWSLLISSVKRDGWREPDYVCRCESKHKKDVMANCPIAIMLDCVLSVDNFGEPVYSKEKLTLGKVEKNESFLHRLVSNRENPSELSSRESRRRSERSRKIG